MPKEVVADRSIDGPGGVTFEYLTDFLASYRGFKSSNAGFAETEVTLSLPREFRAAVMDLLDTEGEAIYFTVFRARRADPGV